MSTLKNFILAILSLWIVSLSFNSFAQPSLEDFLKERDLRNVVISTDGRYLAHLWNKEDMRIVTVTDLESPGKPIVGQLSDRNVRPNSISRANSVRLLVSALVPYNTKSAIRDSEKNEDFDINDYFMFSRTFSMDVTAKNIVMLMDTERSTRRIVNLSRITHYLPLDPNQILMSAYKN